MQQFRKIQKGLHKFKLNGKPITVRYGGIVECTPEDLGSHIDQYEPIDIKGKSSPLKQKTMELEFGLREKSPYLNGDTPPDNALMYRSIPKSLDGLTVAKTQKETELAFIKDGLEAAWQDWELECDQDPLDKKSKKEPEGKHLEKIAKLQALANVVTAELEEINKRIKAATIPVEKQTNKDIERRKWRGVYKKNEDYQIVEADGRQVIYEDDEPVFADDGSSVKEYLSECANRKRARRKESKKRTKAARGQQP